MNSKKKSKPNEKPNYNIRTTNEAEHFDIMASMASFNETNPPSVGFFWYDVNNNGLFGVQSIGAKKEEFDIN